MKLVSDLAPYNIEAINCLHGLQKRCNHLNKVMSSMCLLFGLEVESVKLGIVRLYERRAIGCGASSTFIEAIYIAAKCRLIFA